MNGVSTITQKGQIVIPQAIRKTLNLKPSTRVYLKIEKDSVVIQPVLSINQALGMIETKTKGSQRDYDKAIREKIIRKFKFKKK